MSTASYMQRESVASIETRKCLIVISESDFSRGEAFAKELADAFGVRFVDNAVISEKALAWGADRRKMLAVLSGQHSLLDRLTHKTHAQVALLRAAVADEIREGNAVYYTGAADLFSLRVPHILRIRVERPYQDRLARAQKCLALNSDQAEKHLRRTDGVKRRKNTYLYGASPEAIPDYDLRIDLAATDINEAGDLIRYLIRHSQRFTPTQEALDQVENFVLTTRVEAVLAADRRTFYMDLDVVVEDRSVSLRGRVLYASEIEVIRSLVESVPGVLRVDLTGIWGRYSQLLPGR